jgi:hypothetical protein
MKAWHRGCVTQTPTLSIGVLKATALVSVPENLQRNAAAWRRTETLRQARHISETKQTKRTIANYYRTCGNLSGQKLGEFDSCC